MNTQNNPDIPELSQNVCSVIICHYLPIIKTTCSVYRNFIGSGTNVPDQFRRWQLTLYDIPAGMHLMNWYFDGKERICATAPIISHGNQLRNYIKVTR